MDTGDNLDDLLLLSIRRHQQAGEVAFCVYARLLSHDGIAPVSEKLRALLAGYGLRIHPDLYRGPELDFYYREPGYCTVLQQLVYYIEPVALLL